MFCFRFWINFRLVWLSFTFNFLLFYSHHPKRTTRKTHPSHGTWILLRLNTISTKLCLEPVTGAVVSSKMYTVWLFAIYTSNVYSSVDLCRESLYSNTLFECNGNHFDDMLAAESFHFCAWQMHENLSINVQTHSHVFDGFHECICERSMWLDTTTIISCLLLYKCFGHRKSKCTEVAAHNLNH